MKRQQFLLSILSFLVLGLAMSSCTTRKTFTYLQDVELTKAYKLNQDANLLIRTGDRINVHVSSLYPELVAPLNGGSYQMAIAMPGMSAPTQSSGDLDNRAKQVAGYLVDKDGNILMPVLGKVNVAGKTISQVKDIITKLIIEGNHVSDPRVEVRMANFKVYLLGALNKGSVNTSSVQQNSMQSLFTRINGIQGGILRIYDKDKINILEALALAGDLNVDAQIDCVNVLRQKGDSYVTYRLNLKSVDIFSSPGFYLHQDDIVYVEYRYRGEMEFDRAMQLSGYFFSTVSSIVSMITLFAIFKK